jgi:hypothetical protein
MSKVKLKHASGNSMSIAAPATNPASDLELKLPATVGTAGQAIKNSSTPGTLEFGGVGKLLNATTSSDTITTGTVSISTAWTDCSVTASITPSAATSKILVSGQLFGEGNAADHLFFWRIKKAISGGATSYIEGGGAGSRKTVFGVFLEGGAGDNSSTPTTASFANYLDSPATTSAVTYTFQLFYNGSATFYVNRTVSDADNIAHERGVSYITLMEVGA